MVLFYFWLYPLETDSYICYMQTLEHGNIAE